MKLIVEDWSSWTSVEAIELLCQKKDVMFYTTTATELLQTPHLRHLAKDLTTSLFILIKIYPQSGYEAEFAPWLEAHGLNPHGEGDKLHCDCYGEKLRILIENCFCVPLEAKDIIVRSPREGVEERRLKKKRDKNFIEFPTQREYIG